jgi:hypothetical protein
LVGVLVVSVCLDKRPGVTPAGFPLPIFAGTAYVSWFHVSLPPP